ncbi:hypothetical protein ABIA68_002142 [Stenotrophomonas rhizophila]|uniref:hypothetical protein n=1 Tax=Stenotrophomonas rhizophila TaxID=216778 RepID=UPI003392ACA2
MVDPTVDEERLRRLAFFECAGDVGVFDAIRRDHQRSGLALPPRRVIHRWHRILILSPATGRQHQIAPHLLNNDLDISGIDRPMFSTVFDQDAGQRRMPHLAPALRDRNCLDPSGFRRWPLQGRAHLFPSRQRP